MASFLGFTSCEKNDKGFLHAEGTSIVDANGENFIIRSMGIGSWMVIEPYMLKINQDANEGQHKILNDFEALIGKEKLETFQKTWLDNFFQEQDIIAIKESGFNTIRPALHYNLFTLPIEEEPVSGQDTWLKSGFDRLDSLVSWCEKHELYVILDLHAAPGGQGKNGNINDYDPKKPSLWESDENVRKTIALWGKFAEKYANNTWIGGYDLINEPNWNFNGQNDNGCSDTINKPLHDINGKLITEIRKYDKNHIIFIEGNCWGNNHKGLWPLLVKDDNIGLSFHRYWNENEYKTIADYIDLSKKYNVPLWMSESGENSNEWYTNAICLLEGNNIGWSWWTWKKLNSKSGSYSFNAPENYQRILDYWNGKGEKPDTSMVYNTLIELANNVLLENCNRNDKAIDALMVYKRIHTFDKKEFLYRLEENILKNKPITSELIYHKIPSKIEAGNFYQMKGMKSEDCAEGGKNIGFTSEGDWLSYGINAWKDGNYKVSYRISSPHGGGVLQMSTTNQDDILGSIQINATSNWQKWNTVSNIVELKKGNQIIKFEIIEEGFNINWISIEEI